MFGRRNTLLFCYTTGGLFGIVTVFSSNVWMYLILRFCIATVLKGIGLCCFVLDFLLAATELVAPSKRIFVGNFMWLFFAAGYTVLAGSAKLIPDWRILQLVLTLPYIPLIIITYFFVPESPRWLINQKRSEDAEKVLRKMAKVNKRIISDDFMERAFNRNEVCKYKRFEPLIKTLVRKRRPLIRGPD
ncbi:Solute carrier family 22 member 3 [Holothuria leucospilota]|uniref:Solute carrier family 22 member 3 n=1 Tax=Holothuria leucospilota TaxID=206669 RepID=A0A9Q0Y8W0_HOLLE|nr:Solute carrier family 22 member 3 [Holothuria leucospilota]